MSISAGDKTARAVVIKSVQAEGVKKRNQEK